MKYFPCFSSNQKDFIMNKGLRYLLKCKHSETLKTMWIFVFDEEKRLDEVLAEWTSFKRLNR